MLRAWRSQSLWRWRLVESWREMSNPEYLLDNSIKNVREKRRVEVPAGMVAYWEMAKILGRAINESEFAEIVERTREE